MWLPLFLCLTLMVKALQNIGNIYQPARRNIPEDFYVQQRRCEKLKSYIIAYIFLELWHFINPLKASLTAVSYYLQADFKHHIT